jgi:hypothetical protein
MTHIVRVFAHYDALMLTNGNTPEQGSLALMFFVTAMFLLILVGLPLFCVLESFRYKSSEFSAVGYRRPLWLLLTILVPIVGPIMYLSIPRAKVTAARKGPERDFVHSWDVDAHGE